MLKCHIHIFVLPGNRQEEQYLISGSGAQYKEYPISGSGPQYKEDNRPVCCKKFGKFI